MRDVNKWQLDVLQSVSNSTVSAATYQTHLQITVHMLVLKALEVLLLPAALHYADYHSQWCDAPLVGGSAASLACLPNQLSSYQ